MGRRSRKTIARQAAVKFYGLSSSTKSFPKGTKMEVIQGGRTGELRGQAAKIAAEVEKAWNDNIGSLSRTARLAAEDIEYLAKKLGIKATDKKVEGWMREIVDTHPHIYLIEISKKKKKKLLMVNTDVTK